MRFMCLEQNFKALGSNQAGIRLIEPGKNHCAQSTDTGKAKVRGPGAAASLPDLLCANHQLTRHND